MKDKRRGRPPLPKSQRKTYQRVAMYKKTHKRLVKDAATADQSIVDYLEEKL